jgi:hypothetical protein
MENTSGAAGATGNVVLVGPEPFRRHLVTRTGTARELEATDPGLVESVATPGLFTSGSHVTGLENLAEAATRELVDAVRRSGEPFSGEAEKLSAKQEKALAEIATVRKLAATKSAETVRAVAAALGLQLGAETMRELLERTGHDPGRLVGTLEALRSGGYTTPTAAQVRLLSGTSRESSLPWTLLDRIENGGATAPLLETLEAIPTIAFLAKRVTTALWVAEHPQSTLEETVETLGETTEAAHRGAKKLAQRLGIDGCAEAARRLAVADTLAKRGHPREALLYATGHLRRLLTRC